MPPDGPEFDIVFALKHRAGVKLKRDVDAAIVARAIIDHLERSGWQISRGPGLPMTPAVPQADMMTITELGPTKAPRQ